VAQIGLRQAARLSGKNQSTLHRAMKAGRLSYTTDAAGQRRIDTAELDRVFGVTIREGTRPNGQDGTDRSNGASGASGAHAGQSNTPHADEHAALQRLLDDREASIADLRRRLDASEAERRQLSERLHGLLTARPERRQDGTDLPSTGCLESKDQPAEPKRPRPAGYSELSGSTEPSAASGLAIPRPPWWRRWFR
jgi:hypothetical protein